MIETASRPHRARERGQGLSEFALVFPIMIVLMLALFDLGRVVFLYNGLTNAAREGARLAIVNQDKAMIRQRVQAMAFTAGISNLTNDDLVSFYRTTPNQDATTNPQCTVGSTLNPLAPGCMAVVRAKAKWAPITPFAGSFLGEIEFEARTEMPIQFLCPNPIYLEYDTSIECPRRP